MDPSQARHAILLVLGLFHTILGAAHESMSREFCHNEVFHGSCPDRHVIFMESALYGRMSLGRCVKTDFGFVGCYADVLTVSSRRCSGRQQCDIRIPDVMFDDSRPCNEDLKSYFEARYKCIPVLTADEVLCRGTKPLKAPGGSGYISSQVALRTSCGTHRNPWHIEGRPGQVVNVTLYDFTETDLDSSANTACLRYATITEGRNGRHIEVCAGVNRVRHIYTSIGYKLDVRLAVLNGAAFLLKYDVVGCPDIKRPENTWVKRSSDQLLIGCPSSGQRWRLVCKGSSWFGTIGNCTTEETDDVESMMFGDVSFPVGVSILIIVVVALGIGGAILLVGLVMLRRRTRRTRANDMKDVISLNDMHVSSHSKDFHERQTLKMDYSGSKDPRRPNDYSYVWAGGPSVPELYATRGATSTQHHDSSTSHQGGTTTTVTDTAFCELSEPYGRMRSATSGGPCRDKGPTQYYELDPDVVPHAGHICTADHFTELIQTNAPCSACERYLFEAPVSDRSTTCAIHST